MIVGSIRDPVGVLLRGRSRDLDVIESFSLRLRD